jgi:hypothetical protein
MLIYLTDPDAQNIELSRSVQVNSYMLSQLKVYHNKLYPYPQSYSPDSCTSTRNNVLYMSFYSSLFASTPSHPSIGSASGLTTILLGSVFEKNLHPV